MKLRIADRRSLTSHTRSPQSAEHTQRPTHHHYLNTRCRIQSSLAADAVITITNKSTTVPTFSSMAMSVRALCLLLLALDGSLAFAPPRISPKTTILSPTSLCVSFSNRGSNSRGSHYEDGDDDWNRRPSSRSSGKPNRRLNDRRSYDDEEDWSRPSRNSRSRRQPNSGRRGQRNDSSRKDNSNNRAPRISKAPEEITDTNTHFFSKKSLKDPSLKTSQDIFLPLCQGAGITRPSRIQSLAWPQILKGNQHVIVADQTGSGKTLAYLLPLLQRALTPSSSSSKSQPGAPKVLILAPTAELADQIRAVCTKISETVPFQTMVVTANGKYTTSIRDQIRRIQRTPIDVLISTPGRLSTILRTRNSGLDLKHLQAIVLDEVDILLIDDTFGPQLRTVGEAAPLDQTQFVFVTATLPDQIVQTVQTEFPGVVEVRGPGLHRVAPSLTENLVDVSVPAESNRDAEKCFDVKAKQLLKALRTNRCRRTLIFCNTVESCRSVENLLNRKDRRGQVYEVGAYHNAMTPSARNENLRRFATANDPDVDSVLICTDRAARGVDFDASPVDHVVIFDFPKVRQCNCLC